MQSFSILQMGRGSALNKRLFASFFALPLICNTFYQSPLILTELFQHNLINVSYLTACYLYNVMMMLHSLNDVANDAESTQKSKSTS